MLALLDRYIDNLRRSIRGTSPIAGPFSRVGSIVNVVICAALIAFGVFFGVRGEPSAILLVAAIPLEIIFVRTAIRAHRGDFDAATPLE